LIYAILGQTASGKTSLALKIAKEFSLPVISSDAYQCYRGMSVGTDKPSAEEVKGLDYFFYDEYDPDEDVSVFGFQKECRPLLDRYVKEGKDVLVVGGTFLYLKALLFNYVFEEEKEPSEEEDAIPLEKLQEELKKESPETYEAIDVKNRRRVIRALAQLREGKSRKEILAQNAGKPLYPVTFLRIDIDKDEGNRKIDERVEKMFEEGLVSEVKGLLAKYPEKLRSFLSIGYQEIIEGLEKGMSEEAMKEEVKIHTHQLAKKQRTFLRNQFPEVIHGDLKTMETFLRNSLRMKERTRLLLSPSALNQIEKGSVLFAGLGGVGGEALLSLVRLGFRTFTLVDDDTVDPSNLNRQALYDSTDIGKKKVLAAKERIEKINPLIEVRILEKRIQADADLPTESFDLILDCIDDVDGKATLYRKARKDHSLYFSAMGLGFHLDSTKVRYGKLGDAFDPLARAFKAKLLEEQIPEEEVKGITAVYASDARMKGPKDSRVIGSVSTVPSAGGLALTSAVIETLEKRR
jgi:tRNA dimethylallyltransferase